MITKIQIDSNFLLAQVGALSQVKRRQQTWDEFGEKIASLSENRPQPGQKISDSAFLWVRAKEQVHAALTSADPKYTAIRGRLGNLLAPSTPLLLSTLSMWLAGALGISISVTRPMVAAMLYAVGNSADNWETLHRI